MPKEAGLVARLFIMCADINTNALIPLTLIRFPLPLETVSQLGEGVVS